MPFLIFILLFFCCNVFGQSNYDKLISSPLDAPISIVSAFGEIRPNHFHSGIDLSTYGKSLRVIAAGDGYVSRIRASANGYGKVIYINHPTGITTVYAHLSSFTDSLELFVKNSQIKNRNYEIDTLLPPEFYKVKKGQLIAFSGNSGSSTAPHLHFEVRDQEFQNVLNPLLFNFKEEDKTPPIIKTIAINPKKNQGAVNQSNSTLLFPIVLNKKTKKRGLPVKTKMPVVSGWVSFGFQGGDAIEKANHLSAIYEVQIDVDSLVIFKSRMDQFSFSETRCVNAFINYEMKVKQKKIVHNCIVPSNQMIGIYKEHTNNGFFNFNENKNYKITFTLSDINGNVTVQSINVKGKKFEDISPIETQGLGVNYIKIPSDIDTSFEKSKAEIIFYKETLFDTTSVKFNVKPLVNQQSDLYEIGSIYYPINQPFKIKIRPFHFNDSCVSKYTIVKKSGKTFEGLSTSLIENSFEASSDEFGDFYLSLDTIAPVVSRIPETFKKTIIIKRKGKKRKKVILETLPLKAEGLIRFKIYDALSGINKIDAWLNGDWILLEPGESLNEWKYKFPENLLEGEHTLQIEAYDNCGNMRFQQYCPEKSVSIISP